MRDDLQHDLCPKCALYHNDESRGIYWRMTNPCAGHRHTYRIMTGRAGMELFRQLFSEYKDPFEGILEFEHFKAMPNYETATWLERNCYSLARDLDVKIWKRMKAYLELEEEFLYK